MLLEEAINWEDCVLLAPCRAASMLEEERDKLTLEVWNVVIEELVAVRAASTLDDELDRLKLDV